MIKALNIKNFQSHAGTALELHPGINVIAGQSDSGKSSLLRAFRWAVENRPGGDAFRSWWEGDTVVSLCTGPHFIERRKTDTENTYLLDQADGKHRTIKPLDFNAFGQDVPEEIRNVLNLCGLNTQWQHDRPFLLSETAGEVARQLNKVARLEAINRALSNIDGMSKRNCGAQRSAKAEVTAAEKGLAEYAYLPTLEKGYEKLLLLDDEAADIEERTAKLAVLLTRMDQQGEELDALPDVTEAAELCRTLEGVASEATETRRRLSTLRQLGRSIEQLRESLVKAKRVIGGKKALATLERQREGLLGGRKDLLRLEDAVETYGNALDRLREADALEIKLEKQWEREAPETCPLCGEGKLK